MNNRNEVSGCSTFERFAGNSRQCSIQFRSCELAVIFFWYTKRYFDAVGLGYITPGKIVAVDAYYLGCRHHFTYVESYFYDGRISLKIFLPRDIHFDLFTEVGSEARGGKFQYDRIGCVVNDADRSADIDGVGCDDNAADTSEVVFESELCGIDDQRELAIDAWFYVKPDGIENKMIDLYVSHLRCQSRRQCACNDLAGFARSFYRYGQRWHFHSKVFTEQVPPGTFYVDEE